MKLLKICTYEWDNASRDQRELSVVKELGAEVIVMAKGEPGDSFKEDEVEGFKVFRFGTRPLGANPHLNPLNRVLSIFVWAHKAKKFRADVISGHNVRGLIIGYFSNWFTPKKKRAKLVYDAHEFELGLDIYNTPFKKKKAAFVEKFLMKRCEFSMMVNDTIADEVQKIYKSDERPIVVKNVPKTWAIDECVIKEQRSEFCDAFGILEDGFIVMYHGGVTQKRGVEVLINAVATNPNIYGIILGKPSSEAYMKSLVDLASELNVTDRLLFHPAVPGNELWKYVGAVNCGVSLLQNTCLNHQYALPNKFFECIQSLTPIVVSDFPAIGALVDEYGIGLKCNPESPESLNKAIEKMRTDSELYAQLKKNLVKAKTDLCWEKEKAVLKAAYSKILS